MGFFGSSASDGLQRQQLQLVPFGAGPVVEESRASKASGGLVGREKWDQGSASLTRATDLPAATLPTLRIQMSTRVRICKVPKKGN